MAYSINKQHWRDLGEWKRQGLPLSTASEEAAKLYDAVLTQYVGWYEDASVDGIEVSLEKLLRSDPNFVLGHVLSNGLELIGTGTNIYKNENLKSSIDKMMKLCERNDISEREKKHARAIELWSQGSITKAIDVWEDILFEFPTDLTALKFAHDSYFYLGYQAQMRDSIAKVLPYWNNTIPLYGFLHGMYAFGLVETNFYDLAEKHAKKGLMINPYDCWSTHAMCHVLEMGGRQQEGITFLNETEQQWVRGEMLACHNYWHLALYHIEKGDYETALSIHDQQVSKRCKSGAMLDLVDGSSLLYRLQLEGVNVKERWRDMVELWGTSHSDDHNLVFNDVHLLMSTLGADDVKQSEHCMETMKKYIIERQGTNCDVTREVGLKLCESFIAFNEENYEKSTDLVAPLRYKIVEIGGSNAQRDVFNQFLIHSAMRSPLASHQRLARGLLAERKAMKENSPLTDRLMAKAMAVH